MDVVKRLIGIVAGLFCTLIVAQLCSLCFKMDFSWYISLNKPAFCVTGGWMTLLVAICYISTIFTVAELVEHKWFFPSLMIFVFLGLGCVLFIYTFFSLKNLLAAAVFMTLAQGLSFSLFIRFLSRNVFVALVYLPAFLFNSYAFLLGLSIALAN